MPLPIETGPDENRAHPRHTGRSRVDLVLALTAIFISLVSLTVAVEHGRTEQKLLAANTWPFLQLKLGEGTSEVSVSIVNAGVGPAKLTSLHASLGDRPMKDMDALVRACCGHPAAALGDRLAGGELANAVLRPGQEIGLLQYRSNSGDPGQDQAVRTMLHRLTWRACYCSVFDECWVSNLVDLHPRAVASCPAATDSFNANFFH